jgi:Prolipoprotein diacylglyceryl transferase
VPKDVSATLRGLLLGSFAPRRAFRACGWMGVAIGLPLALATAAHLGLSLVLATVAAVAGIAALLATGMAATILTGEESFIYFRDIPAIFATVAIVVWLARRPVLPYLDCIVLGATAFLACGRIGCLLVGCCHGRPSRQGICYGPEHAACGFPAHYVGVRLFPIQGVESLFVFCLAGTGTVLVWTGAPAGTALSFYIAAYALGRFFIEFGRGDAERPFLWNFSEAQWTSALLLWTIVFAGHWRILPSARWHSLAAAGLLLSMAAIAAYRRFDASHRFQLRHPSHVRELAQALRPIAREVRSAAAQFAANPAAVSVFTTSRGIRVSRGFLRSGEVSVEHYCFSKQHLRLTQREAESLARTITLLAGSSESFQLLSERPGVFHVLPTAQLRRSTA